MEMGALLCLCLFRDTYVTLAYLCYSRHACMYVGMVVSIDVCIYRQTILSCS